jgi:hypothetical protein
MQTRASMMQLLGCHRRTEHERHVVLQEELIELEITVHHPVGDEVIDCLQHVQHPRRHPRPAQPERHRLLSKCRRVAEPVAATPARALHCVTVATKQRAWGHGGGSEALTAAAGG